MKPLYIDLIRSDMSDWLIHCTDSLESLQSILGEACLMGSNKRITGSYSCVCFSEAPLTKVKALTCFVAAYKNQISFSMIRYRPYGVAVRKKWLFEQGGRPVIYQTKDEYSFLPESHRYLHMTYNPGELDFTWEREWRIWTDILQLDNKNTIVFVEKRIEAEELLSKFYGPQDQLIRTYPDYAAYQGISLYPWTLISLEELS